MRDLRDALLLMFISNLMLLASAGLITATQFSDLALDIALVATALTFILGSAASMILAVLSAKMGITAMRAQA